jgi:hypothetical protein
VCHCGSAFTRRDLLTRHQRIATHEKLQDAHVAKSEQGGVSSTVESIAELNTPISPSDIGVNPWEQTGHLASLYHANGGVPDEQQLLEGQMQHPILHQDYYQGKPNRHIQHIVSSACNYIHTLIITIKLGLFVILVNYCCIFLFLLLFPPSYLLTY